MIIVIGAGQIGQAIARCVDVGKHVILAGPAHAIRSVTGVNSYRTLRIMHRA